MSLEKAARLLRKSFELCGKALDGETDPVAIERITKARAELEIAMKLLAERRPAIPLDE